MTSSRSAGASSSHWVFDLDGTLVDGLAATALRPGAGDLLERLVRAELRVSLWSAGGAAYASRVAERVGISGWFGAIADKEQDGAGRWVLPAGWGDPSRVVCIDDDPDRLPLGVRVVAVRPWLGASHDNVLHDLGRGL